ncbi:reprolysin-like metallopeptidase [Pararhodobacter marinus]|uniref:reprolysin-like metallopeptidase n=1 Tax=Pararhodobacter marinus TaxID=2184063 RepID=UPI0035162DF1
MKKYLLFITVAAFCLPIPAYSQQFILGGVAGDLTEEAQTTINALRARPEVLSVQPISLDVSALTQDYLSVDLSSLGGPRFDFQTDPATALDAQFALEAQDPFSWLSNLGFDLSADDPSTVITVDEDGSVNAIIYGEGSSYEIRPLNSSAHILISYDTGSLPPEHPSELPMSPDASQEVPGVAPDQPLTASTIRVLIGFTPEAAGLFPRLENQAQLLVASVNSVLRNSHVRANFELAGTLVVNYEESSSIFSDLNRLAGRGDGYLDDIHTHRDAAEADIVYLIAERTDYCGLAFVNANESHAFGVVAASCGVPNLTFAHELGHNFGACHDPLNSSSCVPYSEDGYGYQHPLAEFRDVMAYECTPRPCPKRPVFSFPPENGEAGRNNVARVAGARAAEMAGFR